jgi:hypothetical protein
VDKAAEGRPARQAVADRDCERALAAEAGERALEEVLQVREPRPYVVPPDGVALVRNADTANRSSIAEYENTEDAGLDDGSTVACRSRLGGQSKRRAVGFEAVCSSFENVEGLCP